MERNLDKHSKISFQLDQAILQEQLRLDQVLVKLYPELTRSRAGLLFDQGLVTFEGRLAKASEKIKQSGKLEFFLPDPKKNAIIFGRHCLRYFI